MTDHGPVSIGIAVYLLLFMAAVIGLARWQLRRKKVRPPMAFKLLRGPGETLRRQVAKYEEDFVFNMGGAALAPWLIGLPVLFFLVWIKKPETSPQFYGIVAVTGAVVLAGMVVAFRWALKGLRRFQSNRLGYLGERAVAEELAVLERQGYRVFHDVPADGHGRAFNVDHVVVGPTGVFAVETKTRRKGRTRPGFKDHEVTFDGRQLVWPWGEDTHGLLQAERQARWLKDWLGKQTGLELEPRPILTIPGWWVTEKKLGPVRVLNPKNVPAAIIGRNVRTLTADQIDLITRQLDARCRDVED